VAIYCHHHERALKLAAAARAIIEKHATLMNLAEGVPEKSELPCGWQRDCRMNAPNCGTQAWALHHPHGSYFAFLDFASSWAVCAVLEALSARPANSVKALGHFNDLLQLCKVAVPALADQIEREMRAELDALRASGRGAAVTDTPANVIAAAADMFAAESMPGRSAAAAPTSLARRLKRGPRWEGWVSGGLGFRVCGAQLPTRLH